MGPNVDSSQSLRLLLLDVGVFLPDQYFAIYGYWRRLSSRWRYLCLRKYFGCCIWQGHSPM